jgi:nucleoside-diphosphate-sugar epimerase
MRVLITGGSGFVGQRLFRYLSKINVNVERLMRGRETRHGKFDILGNHDYEGIKKSLDYYRPDIIFHLAGIVRAQSTNALVQANVGYLSRILDSLEVHSEWARNTRMIVLGSAAEYGPVGVQELPVSESYVGQPISPYGATKLAQTQVALSWANSFDRFVMVVRPFSLVGPGVPKHTAIGNFVDQLAKIKAASSPAVLRVGNLDTSRDIMDVDDAAEILWKLSECESASGKIINLCSGAPVNIRDVLEYLIGISGGNIKIKQARKLQRQVDMKIHFGDDSLLNSILSVRPKKAWKTSLSLAMEHRVS